MKLILSECINEVNIDAVTTEERGIGTESRLKSKLGLRLMYAVLCVYMCLNYFFLFIQNILKWFFLRAAS